jgi:hypothetical protein
MLKIPFKNFTRIVVKCALCDPAAKINHRLPFFNFAKLILLYGTTTTSYNILYTRLACDGFLYITHLYYSRVEIG